MIEIKNTTIEIENDFSGFTSKLDKAKKRMSELFLKFTEAWFVTQDVINPGEPSMCTW